MSVYVMGESVKMCLLINILKIQQYLNNNNQLIQ